MRCAGFVSNPTFPSIKKRAVNTSSENSWTDHFVRMGSAFAVEKYAEDLAVELIAP